MYVLAWRYRGSGRIAKAPPRLATKELAQRTVERLNRARPDIEYWIESTEDSRRPAGMPDSIASMGD